MIWGLHWVDWAIVIILMIGMLVIGAWLSSSVKEESDFFVGGRKMGRLLQFFLNFGNMADSNGAPVIAGEVYRTGVGGMWIGFQNLFATPFFWFTSVWFRRTRLMTQADLFADRFENQRLGAIYAAIAIAIAIVGLALGNVISYKVAAAMILKPKAEWTAVEAESVQNYIQWREIREKLNSGKPVTLEDRTLFATLDSLEKQGRLAAYVSYLKPVPFYIIYTLIVAAYMMMGGLKAAAVTDALQGGLIIIFSLIMIPLGLSQTGGFKGLHDNVPDHMFHIFGAENFGEYTWYSIGAIILTSLICAANGGGPAGAAARDEATCRFGVLSGAFSKRFVMIAWMFCGLLAVGLLPSQVSDSDQAWGALAKHLLGPGLIGFMISGMLLGHMPMVGLSAVTVSAMWTRVIYEPLVTGKSQRHYLVVAKIAILAVLAAGVIVALFFTQIITVMTTLITFNAFLGAVFFLMYFWRKLTVKAVGWSMAIWLIGIGLLPWALPKAESFRRLAPLLLQAGAPTMEKTPSSQKLLNASEAEITPLRDSVFFDKVSRIDAHDPRSPLEGMGRFNVEILILQCVGVPVQNFNKAQLVAARWLFDGLVPFLLLIGLSYLTPPPHRQVIDRFYAKMKTKVVADFEEDKQELALSYADPARFDHLKLFPRSNWEFTRWTRNDIIGFLGCWVGVLLVLSCLFGLLRLGA